MGERDNETPPERMRSEAGGRQDGWRSGGMHVYPEATHCWDCKNLDGAAKVDFRGNQIVYRYDKGITSDSARRMFEFLERTLAARR
jgi:dienelactone hydrolase